jgi:oxygen-dependent protoporphyrinogen oxidase
MKKFIEAQVIIVGAGIAGLTAAWKLKQSGIQVLVLEADQDVGGRMRSLQVEDALIDTGAQFLSSAYTIIPKLIEEVGLSHQYVATSEWGGLVRNKKTIVFHTRKPWHLVTRRILSLFDFFKLEWNQFRLFQLKKKSLVLNDITTWTQYDEESALAWSIRHFGHNIPKELTSTLVNGFYFQSLNTSAASMLAPILAFSAYTPRTMTLTRGMGSLPEKLAERLNVKTGVSVSRIEETAEGVKVISNVGEFNAKHVVLTVPAPIAKNILHHPDEHTLSLLETSYSSSATISFLIDKEWAPPSKLSSVYGLLFNPHFECKIAALTIENNKHPSRKNQDYLINAMLSDKGAKQLLHLRDEEIAEQIRLDVETVLPGIYQHLQTINICRWPHAMPCTPLGRATAVKKISRVQTSTQ